MAAARSFLTKSIKHIPTNANAIKTGMMLMEDRDTKIPVMVVPNLAPNTNAPACAKVMMPALTKPMLMTVVAAEDCTMAVAPAPKP